VFEIVPPRSPKELALPRFTEIVSPKAGTTAVTAITHQINLCRIFARCMGLHHVLSVRGTQNERSTRQMLRIDVLLAPDYSLNRVIQRYQVRAFPGTRRITRSQPFSRVLGKLAQP